VAAISFDALRGAEALPVVGVAHAGMAVALAGCTKDTTHTPLSASGSKAIQPPPPLFFLFNI